MQINFEIPALDVAAITLKLEAERSANVANAKAHGRFIGVSLGAWLEHARTAGVPFVAATQIATMPRASYLAAMESGDFDSDPKMGQTLQALSSLAESDMARFDPCGGIELKQAMGAGEIPTLDQRQDLAVFDPRAFDIISDYPADEIPIWSRPWIAARMIGAFPVEFRVFILNNEIRGIANYYPQRPLPQTLEISSFIGRCVELSTRLVEHLRAAGQSPWMPNYEPYFAPGQVHATLDFLVTDAGEVVFLEAGPPFGAGAHPCAFNDREITGIALALADGVELR